MYQHRIKILLSFSNFGKISVKSASLHASEQLGPGDCVVLGHTTGGNPGPRSRKRGQRRWVLSPRGTTELFTSSPGITASQSTARCGNGPRLMPGAETADKTAHECII